MNSGNCNKNKKGTKSYFRLAGYFSLFTLFFCISSCKKLVEADTPVSGVAGSAVFTTDGSAIAAVTGMYSSMASGSFATGANSVSVFSGLSSDELTAYGGLSSSDAKRLYYTNSLHANSTGTTPGTENWANIYNYVFIANSTLEGLDKSSAVTPGVRQQLIGEAKFMRALFYFYLVNLWGDVPLVVSTDYTVNRSLSRASKSQVYNQIISDLKDAQELMSTNYLKSDAITAYSPGAEERIRPNKWAATALLARVYLFTGDFQKAEEMATLIINNVSLYDLASLNNVFLKNSKEAIWQLQPVKAGHNTEDGWLFILPGTGPNSNNPVYLSNNLLTNFELGDQRRYNRNWIDSVKIGTPTVSYFFPTKYKSANLNASVTEYLMVLRVAEQYLIRAEARARLGGNLLGAIDDLDKIRGRANLPLVANTNPGISQNALIDKIIHERQVELFSEWGHRWLDLKRTNTVDAIMGIVCPQKGGTWNSNWALYPISLFDIQKDPNLMQNPGY
jgi:hypothetical protein